MAEPVNGILPPDNPVKAFLIARWDNVLGPHWLYLWSEVQSFRPDGDSTSTASWDVEAAPNVRVSQWIKYVTSHTLEHPGTLMDGVLDEIQHSWVVVPDLCLAYFAVTFWMQEEEMQVPHSCTFLTNIANLATFMQYRVFMEQWLKRIIPQIKILVLKSLLTEGSLDKYLEEVQQVVSLRKEYANPLDMPLQEVLLLPELESCLTSHLQTFGNTVVIGNNPDKINTLISFLMLFLKESEQYCCKTVTESHDNKFHCGIFLQGLLQDKFGQRNIPSSLVCCNPYPVTIINLSTRQEGVKQSSLYKVHCVKRELILKQELMDLWHGTGETCASTQNVLRATKDVSDMVRALLSHLRKLSVAQWTERINLFHKSVQTKVWNLLALLNTQCSKLPVDKRAVKRKWLCSAMNLNEADMLIVLSAAEKLRPGTYNYVLE